MTLIEKTNLIQYVKNDVERVGFLLLFLAHWSEWLKTHNVHHDLLVMRPDKFKADSWPIAAGNLATKDMRFMSDDILKKKMKV